MLYLLKSTIRQRVGGKVDERVDPLMMAQIGFNEWFNEGCIRAEEIMKDSVETEGEKNEYKNNNDISRI